MIAFTTQHLKIGFAWITFLVLFFGSDRVAESASPDDSLAIVEQIKTLWSGFDSFECHSLEIVDGMSAELDGKTEIDFFWKMDGRSALAWNREQQGKMTYLDVRDDGTRRVSLSYFLTPPKAVDHVFVDRPENTAGSYNGVKFCALWAFLPGGKTIKAILEDGQGNLKNTGTTSKPHWMLMAQVGRYSMKCALDENHQYLPKVLSIKSEEWSQTIEVETFEQANGFWYPATGKQSFDASKDYPPLVRVFRVNRVAINDSIANKTFEMPELSPGMDVVDQVNHTNYYVGGKLARINLMNLHPLPREKAPSNSPVKAPRDVNEGTRFWTRFIFFLIALIAGGFGFYFRRRGA